MQRVNFQEEVELTVEEMHQLQHLNLFPVAQSETSRQVYRTVQGHIHLMNQETKTSRKKS